MKMTSDQTRELLQLLTEVDGHSKGAAKQVFNGITPEGRLALLHELRRRKLEKNGQSRLPLGRAEAVAKAPASSSVGATKAKKVPYTLLMPPEQLEALKDLAEKDDTSVSHHIRQAVRAYLRTRPV